MALMVRRARWSGKRRGSSGKPSSYVGLAAIPCDAFQLDRDPGTYGDVTPFRGDPDSGLPARQRYATIRHSIPKQLDAAAQLLEDSLDLVVRYGLAEALQPQSAPYRRIVDELRTAAARIRAAATEIPDPATWSASTPTAVRDRLVPAPSHGDTP